MRGGSPSLDAGAAPPLVLLPVQAVLKRRRVLLLAGILAVVALGGVAATIAVLYDTAMEQEGARLAGIARSRARILEAVARFDASQSPDFPGGPLEATLSQFREARETFGGFGRTGEFTLARREGDAIVFLLGHRHEDVPHPDTVPFDGELAEAQRRALRGESGTVIGPDYRGEEVLAAHEPVGVHGLGVVAKVDMAEIRAPFIEAAFLALGVGLLLVGIGTVAVRAVGRGYERELEEANANLEFATHELAAREARYAAIARNLPRGAVHVFDPEMRYVFSEGEELRELGLDPEEMIGESIHDVLPPETAALVEREYGRVLEGESVRFEGEMQGETFLVSAAPLRESAAEPERVTGILALSTNITGLREAERAAEEARERAERYLDVAEVLIVALDREGRIGMVNRAGCELLGYEEPEELVGEDWFGTAIPEADRERMEAAFREMIDGGATYEYFENPVVTRSGERRLVAWRNTLLRDDDGRVAGTLSSGLDITDRRAAEEALRESEERLKLALAASGHGLYDIDLRTDEIVVNEEYARTLGRDPEGFEETVGDWLGRMHPEDRASTTRAFEEYLAGERDDFAVEFRQLGPDGEWRWIRSVGKIAERDEEGEPVRMLGTQSDISERRRAEEELRQAQKMETVGRLTAGIAHDMNNILTAIMGAISLAADELPGDADGVRADLDRAQDAAGRGAALLARLMAFSRREELRFEEAEMARVCREAMELLRRLLPETIRLVYRSECGDARAEVDRAAVEQIVVNLATNARDAIEGDGVVEIVTDEVEVEEEPPGTVDYPDPGRYVRIRVRDDGKGMDAETRERIFEPFFTTKPPEKGTGLGLAVVLRLVRQHGGTIAVSSEAGEGTTVDVYFPVVAGAEEEETPGEAPAAGATARPEGRPATILLVEDEEQIRGIAARVLERAGHTVVHARNGTEALRELESRNGEIDLVLSDVVMPEMGGAELREEARAAGCRAAFLFTSGYTPEEVADRLGELHGEARILPKPWTPEELLAAVEEALDGGSGSGGDAG